MGKYHMSQVGWYYIVESYDKCGKVVYKLCSSCINNVQELNKNSIEFSLSTQTRSVVKLSQTKLLYLYI